MADDELGQTTGSSRNRNRCGRSRYPCVQRRNDPSRAHFRHETGSAGDDGVPSCPAGLRGLRAPRSGSNYFCELLSSTGILGHPREYFNGAVRRQRDDPTYPDDPLEQIGRILTMGATPNGVYALKLFPACSIRSRRI